MAEDNKIMYIGQTDTIWGNQNGEVCIAEGDKTVIFYARQLLDDLPSLYDFALKEVAKEDEWQRERWLKLAKRIQDENKAKKK